MPRETVVHPAAQHWARISRPVGGPSSITLDVGQIGVALRLKSGCFSREIEERYRLFATSRKPEFSLSLEKCPRAVSRLSWLPKISTKGRALSCRSSQFEWDVHLDTGKGRGRFRNSEQAFDSVLRAFYASIAPVNEGIILHSAALKRNGSAYLFAGESGAGKTTISRTMAGSSVQTLTDELALLRRIRNKLVVFGTPFWGEFSKPDRNASAPLKKIFLIVKSKGGPRKRPLSRVEAQRRLLKCLVSFQSDRDALQRSWDFLWDAICAVPVEEFHWHRADPIDKVIEAIE